MVESVGPAGAGTLEQAQACRLTGVLSRLQHQAPGDAAMVLCTATQDGRPAARRLMALLAGLPEGAWSDARPGGRAAALTALSTRPFALDDAFFTTTSSSRLWPRCSP